MQDSDGTSNSQMPYQAISTLGMGAGANTATVSSVGGKFGANGAGPLALSHSILTKDESLERYGPLKSDQTPPLYQPKGAGVPTHQ